MWLFVPVRMEKLGLADGPKIRPSRQLLVGHCTNEDIAQTLREKQIMEKHPTKIFYAKSRIIDHCAMHFFPYDPRKEYPRYLFAYPY
jgi:hypothetical protein